MSRLVVVGVVMGSLPFAAPMACASDTSVPRAGEGGGGGEGGNGSVASGGGGTSSSTATTSSTSSGLCVAAADCAALSDVCNVGTCVNGTCEAWPANEGSSCDDGLFCTKADTCEAGLCVGGPPTYCPSLEACHVGQCEEATDSCVQVPGADGTNCVDSDPCTQTGTCSAGACLPGKPVDCSFLDGTCSVGACDPLLGCVATPQADGAACDDGQYCTIDDTCAGGACSGEPNTCAAPGDVCLIGTCDEAYDACVTVPGPDGIACDDASACTTGETCGSGVCTGGAPANEGGACDDGKKCTSSDACTAGVCAGTPIVVCQNADGCCAPGCDAAVDDDCKALDLPSYDASVVFKDALPSTTMTIAWDGTHYWSCSGGSSSGDRLAQYTEVGTLVAVYQPNIDFRSVFTKVDGALPILARGYYDPEIRVQNGPGAFGTLLALSGGQLNEQSGIAYDADKDEYVAMYSGTVTRWTASGALAGTTELVGYGSVGSESSSPQNRGVFARQGYYLTYSGGMLSAWDAAGARVKTTTLSGAGTTSDSYYSFSFAHGMVFVADGYGGMWRGYDVGL